MKQKIITLVTLLTIFGSMFACAQNNSKTKMKKVDTLIQQEKYATAFQELSKMAAIDSDPEIVVRQFRFIPEYFVQSMMHQMFVFKDLEEGETIESLRGNLGVQEFEMILFDPVKVYESYIKKNGPTPLLDLALGEYYQDAILRYGDQWIETRKETEKKIEKLFFSAYNNDIYTDRSASSLGYIELARDNYEQAQVYYQKSIELNPENANSHYNLAIILITLGNTDQFFFHIDEAIKYYEDPEYKADSYVSGARGALQLENYTRAIEYLTTGAIEFPQDYRFPQNLTNISLHLKKYKDAERYADEIFALDSTNPNAAHVVMDMYFGFELFDQLEEFFLRNIKKYKTDHDSLGNLYFHLALFYQNRKKNELFSQSLEKAKEHFKIAPQKNKQALEVIEQLRNSE